MNIRLKFSVFKFIVILSMVLSQITALQLQDQNFTASTGTVPETETVTAPENVSNDTSSVTPVVTSSIASRYNSSDTTSQTSSVTSSDTSSNVSSNTPKYSLRDARAIKSSTKSSDKPSQTLTVAPSDTPSDMPNDTLINISSNTPVITSSITSRYKPSDTLIQTSTVVSSNISSNTPIVRSSHTPINAPIDQASVTPAATSSITSRYNSSDTTSQTSTVTPSHTPSTDTPSATPSRTPNTGTPSEITSGTPSSTPAVTLNITRKNTLSEPQAAPVETPVNKSTETVKLVEVQRPQVKGEAEEQQLGQPDSEESENKTWEKYTYLITGGYRPAQNTLAQYLVSISGRDILYYYGDDTICAGAIIASNLILSTAHCLARIWNKGVFSHGGARVVAGTPHRLWRSNSSQERVAVQLINHPKYSLQNKKYDIALIKLDKGLELNDKVQIIPLPVQPVKPGTMCTVVGWGRVSEYEQLPSKALYAPVQIWPNSLCQAYKATYIESTICTNNIADEEVDACEGSTGSPLICDDRLIGISLDGLGCSFSNVPGYYTDVYRHLEWISHYDNGAVSVKIGAPILYVILALALWRAL